MISDRSKLAKAIGVLSQRTGSNAAGEDCWSWDPFTDANADYSVLLWAREKMGIPRDVGTRYRDFMFELGVLQLKRGKASSCLHEAYQIGDYARAALRILNEDNTK